MPVSRRNLVAGALACTALSSVRAQPAADVVRIGVLTDLSGQYRDNSGPTSVLAAKQAVEDFAPEQHGFRVEIIAADHQQKPDVGAAIARQWFDRDGVDAVADVNNTAIALAVDGVAKEHDKAVLITGAASADLTGKFCTPNSVHFPLDTYGGAHSTGNAVLDAGGDSWFLVVADYTFGHALEGETRKLVEARGGKVLGVAAYPFPGTTDFSSFLLQARASGAKVVGFCNTGGDMENCVKQAQEFSLATAGIKVVAMFGFITEVKAIGLPIAQGLLVSETFYWNLNDRSRAFTKRFSVKSPNNYPSSLHAACYAGTLHYLKAVAAMRLPAARASGAAAIATMKRMPTDDDCFGRASIRADGRFLCPVHLFRVKTPEAATVPWDLYDLVATTPGEQAFRPLSDNACPLVHS